MRVHFLFFSFCIVQMTQDVESSGSCSVQIKDSVRGNWILSDLIQQHVPQSDKILQLYDNQLTHSEYLVKTNNFIIIAVGAFIVLIYLVGYISCIVIGVCPSTLPRRHIYTPCEKKYPPITLLVCALFVFLSAAITLYYTVQERTHSSYFKEAYQESNCILDTILPKFKYGLNLPGSKFAGVESLVSSSELAIASFANVTSAGTNFTQIVNQFQTISTNLNTTLNTLSQTYQSASVPVPYANSADTFQTDIFATWGTFQLNENTSIGKLALEKVPAMDSVLTNVESIGQSTSSIQGVQNELKAALENAKSAFISFNTTNYHMHGLLTENQSYLDSSVHFATITLYVLSSLLILAMLLSVVAVMCIAFWPVGKRGMMLQFGWMFLGGITFLTCACAVFMTFVTLSGAFPICNGYDTLFGSTANLYAHPHIIPREVADVYNECLYGYSNSETGRGNVVEAVVIRGTGNNLVNETTWKGTSASLLSIRKNFVLYLTNKENILFNGKANYTSALVVRVRFEQRKPSQAAAQNTDPTHNSKTQYERLNAMVNAYVTDSYQNTVYNCPSSVYTNDTIVEEDADCPDGVSYYQTPPFWRSQDFSQPYCLRFSEWTSTQIFNRYSPRFSSCTNSNSTSTLTLGDEVRDQYSAYQAYYDAVKTLYQQAETDISNYQTQLLSGAASYKQRFPEINQYLFQVTPLIQAFANQEVGLSMNYECPLIAQQMYEVYQAGCSRLVPYALNLTLLLWCSTVFASISSCMGLAFVRRSKEDDSDSFI